METKLYSTLDVFAMLKKHQIHVEPSHVSTISLLAQLKQFDISILNLGKKLPHLNNLEINKRGEGGLNKA